MNVRRPVKVWKPVDGATNLLALLVGAAIALVGCAATAAPTSAPDLTRLATALTSPDPNIQETGLTPALRTSTTPAVGVLPSGSSLTISADSWKVVKVDPAGHPYLAQIKATLIRPRQPAELVSLHLVFVENQWLLYETSPK
jgi:hypothetical protein